MREGIFCFILIFFVLPLSACGRSKFEDIRLLEADSEQAEQYQSTSDVITENQDNVIVELKDNVESDMDELISDYGEDITLSTVEEAIIPDDAYASVLDEFRTFCADTSERGSYSIEGTVASYYHMDDAVLYYSYYDIDKNGVLELLISMGNDEDIGGIVDVFGLNDSEIVCIQGNDTLGDRSQLTIYTDGTWYREDSGGADNGVHTFYRLDSDGFGLKEIEKYIYDSDKMPAPFFNSNKSLTDDEFYALLDNYEVVSDIEWYRLEVEEIADYDQLYKAFSSVIKGEHEIYFWQDDFDCDGQEEAFGITGIEQFSNLENVRIYYISSDGEATCIDEISNMYGYGDSYFLYPDVEDFVFIDTGDTKFLSLGGIDGQVVWLYGVKNGSAYQPEVSGEFFEFSMDEENCKRYRAYESSDGGEGVKFYEYDIVSQEFVEVF